MNTALEFKKLHRKMELIEAIEALYQRKKRRREALNGFPGTFPRLRKSLENGIDTADRCILKLTDRYYKL